MIIISYIIGALLPIVALFMTTMVANNLKLMGESSSDNDIAEDTESIDEHQNDNEIVPKNEFDLPNKKEIIEQAEKSLKTRRIRSVDDIN